MNKSILASWFALFALLGYGCHTPPPPNTPSGRPEVLIQGMTAQQILNTSRDFFLHRGYTVVPSDNVFKLILNRRTEKPGAKASASECWRVHLALVDLTNGSFRLLGTPTKVEGCGGELESEHTMVAAFPQIQALLEEIKTQLGALR